MSAERTPAIAKEFGGRDPEAYPSSDHDDGQRSRAGQSVRDQRTTGPVTLSVRVHGQSDVGLVRKRNEDAYHVDDAAGLGVVADGMGGAPAGALASSLAVRTVLGVVASESGATRDDDLCGLVRHAMEAADQAVRAEGESNPLNRGLGCTLTVLRVDPRRSRFAVGHVGDSRAYRFRGGTLEQLTQDHTLAQESVDQGRLPPDAVRHHPFGHILTRVIGMAEGAVPQILEGEVVPGDAFFLCTDGVIRVIEEEEIERVLRRDLSLAEVASLVIREANDRGGPDNSTVVLMQVNPGPA